MIPQNKIKTENVTKTCFSTYLQFMSKVELSAIAQDLFLINDLYYKHSFGKNSKLNGELNIYLYKTILEGERVSLFLLDVSGTTIVVPASKEWDEVELDGLYKIECIECEGKFIFKDHNHTQTIKSASVTSIYDVNSNEWEIEYRILDNKIRRFDILNQIIKQDDDSLAKKALSIIFNDEAEILAEKVLTTHILLENAKAQLAYLEDTTDKTTELGYINITKNNISMDIISIDVEDKGKNYYVVDLLKLNHCLVYQQYIMLFYIKSYFDVRIYTDIRLVQYDGKKYLVFINQNEDMIIDMTFIEVIDILIRDDNKDNSDNIIVDENGIPNGELVSNSEEETNVSS